MIEPLGERLARARGWAGASARELSGLAGLSSSMVTHLENGRIGSTTVETIDRLAQVLGVSMDWLARGRGEQPSAEQVREAVDKARAAAAGGGEAA